ncbi:hypothetical protein BLL40_16230 [Domibacillus mangrovi]|uniref:Uncharacterized protein n=1 Tax=Domibacillus mangrovi TaxID=1714354 RepID=A0A1Q5NZ68_9BACI|nr:hypothetical protein BLL40_16230 [Domibacillus mangrovi]
MINIEKTGKIVVIGLALIIFYLALSFLGINPTAIFMAIEWITKFILPWIFSYWFMRLVKILEKKN